MASGCGTSEHAADAAIIAPPIALEPDLRVDGYDADLVPIQWMGVAPNGTMALIQRQDHNVRFFDASGADLGSVGREGDGPGEFRLPTRGGWLGDTLWISDLRPDRVTLISPALEVIRTLPPITEAAPMPPDTAGLPTFPWVYPHAVYGDGTMLVMGMPAFGDPLAARFKGTLLMRLSGANRIERLVLETPEDRGNVRATTERLVTFRPVPFFPSPAWSVSARGDRVAVLTTTIVGDEAGTFEVTLYDAADGSEVYRRSFPFEATPIPVSVADSAMESVTARINQPELLKAIRSVEGEVRGRIPPVYPPVHDIVIGWDGRVWVAMRRTPEGNPWLVLDRDGEPMGRVLVPGNVSLKVADQQHAWGIETDDVGMQSVVRYVVPETLHQSR